MADDSPAIVSLPEKPAQKPAVEVVIKSEWCKNCGICIEFCPKNVFDHGLYRPKIARPENCSACGMCIVRCPDYALSGHKNNEEE